MGGVTIFVIIIVLGAVYLFLRPKSRQPSSSMTARASQSDRQSNTMSARQSGSARQRTGSGRMLAEKADEILERQQREYAKKQQDLSAALLKTEETEVAKQIANHGKRLASIRGTTARRRHSV